MISISDMLDATWKTLRSHYKTFGVYLLLLALPIIIATLLQPIMLDMNPETGTAIFSVKNALIGGTTQIIVSLVTLLFSIAAIFSTYTILQHGTTADITGDLHKSLRLLLPTFLLSIMVSIAITLGFLLLIIPGVIVAIMLTFSYHVYILEHTTLIGAMKKSTALVKGRFWTIFAHLAVLTIVVGLIVFLITLLPTILLPMLNLDALLPFINTLMSSISAVAVLVGLTFIYLHAKNNSIQRIDNKIIIGIILIIIGVTSTIVSYLLTAPGETYFIYSGAIIVGLYNIYQGLFKK